MKKIQSLALLMILLITGCNQNQNTAPIGDNRNGNEAALLENRQTEQENEPEHEGQAQYITRINRMEIREQVREVVEETDHLSLDSVMINGQDLWVIAHSNKRLTPRGVITENAELHKRLEKIFPQFHVEVRVEGSW